MTQTSKSAGGVGDFGLRCCFYFAWFLSYFFADVVRSGLTRLPLVSLSTTIAPDNREGTMFHRLCLKNLHP